MTPAEIRKQLLVGPNDLNPEENAAVAQAMTHYLTEPMAEIGMPDDPHVFMAPIMPGVLRETKRQLWASWHEGTWFDLALCPADDMKTPAFRYVVNDDGAPLGNRTGPLVLLRPKGTWLAMTIRVGWQYENIIWPQGYRDA